MNNMPVIAMRSAAPAAMLDCFQSLLWCRVCRGGWSRLRTLLPPTAAKGLVQRHPIILLGQAVRDQSLQRRIVAALRVEHREIAESTDLVAALRERVSAACGLDQRFLRLALAIQCPGQRQGISHLTEAGLNGFLILCQRDIFV